MPKISVIIPIYNTEKYLKECLDSFINQTFKDIEVICINDGSTDNSLDILKEYQKKDNRIIVINKKNTNAGDSRNIGFEKSCGDYVLFFDSDDYVELNMLEIMYNNSISKEADITICESKRFFQETEEFEDINDHDFIKEKLNEDKILIPNKLPQFVFQGCVGWAWDSLYKRNFIIKNNLKFQSQRHSNDMCFVYLSMALANKISYIDNNLITHRKHPNSLEATRKKQIDCFYFALKGIMDGLKERNIYYKFEQSFINRSLGFTIWYISTIEGKINKLKMEGLFAKFLIEISFSGFKKEYFYNEYEHWYCSDLLYRKRKWDRTALLFKI